MNDEFMPNFYSVIPADLRYDNRMKATEKIFFSEISALTNLYGYCYASNKYFAKLYDCDVRTITRWNCIEIKHNIKGEEFYSFYAHLSKINVMSGQQVTQGTIIAIEGGDPKTDPNVGSSTGHHLHFEIRKASRIW